MNIRLSAAAAAVAAAFPFVVSTPAWADAEGETVVVTATRTARTMSDTLASVSVVTREDIEAMQARSSLDLLRGLPGMSIGNNGGLGKNTSIFLRGTESDHVLVLIDGIKVGSATSGATAIQDIPVEQIERIEVVRGPRSGLYGSEAIGGVIQIFTRRGGGPLTPSFSAGFGSDRTWRLAAGLSGGGEQTWFNVSASGLETDGFNACSGKPFPGGAGCFTTEPDRDGYRNVSGSARAGLRLPGGGELDFNWLRTDSDNEFDGTTQNEGESRQEVFGGRLKVSPLAAWDVSLSAGLSRDHSDNFKDGVFASRFESDRETLSLQNDFQLAADHGVTLGYDWQKDKVSSTTPFPVRSRDNEGLFIQYLGEVGAQTWQISGRADDNEQFGVHRTGSVAWGYEFNRELNVFASYGTAFKAPTFNELYFPFFGNPDLEPETARNIEVGLSGEAGWGRWSTSVYRMRVEDLIAFDAALGLPNNIDSALITGLEGTLGTQLLGWDVNASVTLLDPENRASGANRGNVLPRRAEQSARIDIDRGFGSLRVGASLLAAGRRYDDVANTRRLGGYGTLDLRAEYAFHRDWRVQARVENVFDKDYETASFFNQQGRGAFVTVRYEPKR
ncbi:TonB-dependent vitamin B12 receptor [Aromatoleum buckelii]|uniref:TonB-dependent vitamin B12 receptor n=1 Tax=Aromatoleum buckelii TaxID=200254 RepID=A0ABX1N5K0_9RHOO|nr:TonB-dependent vitamin B12 receptor [Aromatoleum buckelii]MCK0510623.1 TonB-dependent vitamin B12 receptor [Aromatoleum buckelii]